ncbi:hypothetical protein [Arthrobacter sp. MYb227]|uniref:sunset domain-containing protein n=1 Tax=Arthrobacter sp. MYb227 TaxID=1848601 RepID=UPI0021580F91|nr:hypothetical protein [Arthrobacter sp. MYb227]
MFRSLTALAAATALVFSGAVAASAAPVALSNSISVAGAKKATPAVTIKTIGGKTVSGSKKATIKPLVSAKKGVKVTSKVLTVKQGKKTIVNKKASASLKAGTYKVTTTVKYKSGKKTLTTSKNQTLVIKKAAVKKPAAKKSWVAAKGKNCPAGYPVKGNKTGSNKEWKYHVRGGAFYNRTIPEQCFKTTSDARKAGYRASKR